jgi:hypothetical protein
MIIVKANLNIFPILVVTAVLALSFQACSTERKTAVAYTKKANTISLLVLKPEHLFKINQKLYLLDSLEPVPKDQEAQLLLDSSLFLRYLDDSLFIAQYMSGYKSELVKFGFRVYDESNMEQFFNTDSNAIQVSVAQLELEETIYPFRDEGEIYGETYYHQHELNAVYVNSWFDIADVDHPTDKPSVYFATDMLVDQVNGTFEYDVFANQVRYLFNLEPLDTKMLTDFAYDLGRVYAGYTFDYLLNKELDKTLPPDERSGKYWRYNPYNRSFFLAGEDRFTPLDQ